MNICGANELELWPDLVTVAAKVLPLIKWELFGAGHGEPGDGEQPRGGKAPAAAEGSSAGLKTKAAPTRGDADNFEIEQTGPLNYLVIGGGVKVWADGCQGRTLMEAKHVGKPGRSPFVDGSKVPDFIWVRTLTERLNEFSRYAAVIHDPNVPFNRLLVLTNEPRAVPYFQLLMTLHGIPGEVRVVETQVGKKKR